MKNQNMCKMGFGVGLSSRAGSSWRPVLGSGFDFFLPPKIYNHRMGS
jgi:hypothetical protein